MKPAPPVTIHFDTGHDRIPAREYAFAVTALANAVVRGVCPVLRRVEFPGKRRLRWRLPLPTSGSTVARFPEGFSLRLDLRESLQRDYLAGLHDRRELRLIGRLLAAGGDFVDVGAHVGIYSVFAAVRLRGVGRVLALEPNPRAREQLLDNLALNRCDNAVVVGRAASDSSGEAVLHVPDSNDPSFSTLGEAGFAEGEPVRVETTTVDREVATSGLEPSVVKIDAENHELAVLDGMQETLARSPAVLCEVGPETAAAVEERLAARGYMAFRVGPRGVRPGPLAHFPGYFNAFFVPEGAVTPDD
jgi:FkbM family methyltransferase